MPSTLRLCLLAAATLAAGCGLTRTTTDPDPAAARPAPDAPARFEPVAPFARVAPADTFPGSGCLTALVDPGTGVTLALVRSAVEIGDYQVPDGRFGVARDHLLQVECNTGRTRGIVRR